ncbi:MAG: ATPase, T2SS/T4P/T4SS family [Actinomycetota bacterium]|nr:ATPase, T2SS/T4P/T4SS family [Actinomycetota bacterium]
MSFPVSPATSGERSLPGRLVPGGGGILSPLARFLLQEKVVNEDALRRATEEQRRRNLPLTRILIENKVVDEVVLGKILATRLGLEFIDLAKMPIDPGAASLISRNLALKHEMIPIGHRDNRIVVAAADPNNVSGIDDFRAYIRKEIIVVVAARTAILSTIDRLIGLGSDSVEANAIAASEIAEINSDTTANLKEIADEGPIVKLVNATIAQAVNDRASDIHIEPQSDGVRLRHRIDGVLHEVSNLPKNLQSGVISRIKIMADLNIAERRVPQDGRISGVIGGRSIDLRVATLPTNYGEKVVLRILENSTAMRDLADLGFLPRSLEAYSKSFKKPYGTILVTGPTGSGKSTTLYATLNVLNSKEKNVITVEDPVEYRIAGINQVQVNSKAGLSFASVLKSILRSDPDIVMVGEIRDRETAIIATELALTGHLVLSTIHTNDAASTPARLVEMGVEPYLVSSALDCIVAQRLARRLCDNCKVAYSPSVEELKMLNFEQYNIGVPTQLYRPEGCGICSGTGYRGRFAIHEVMTISDELERLIASNGNSHELRDLATSQGMIPMRAAGLQQVAAGMTTIEEIFRVIV